MSHDLKHACESERSERDKISERGYDPPSIRSPSPKFKWRGGSFGRREAKVEVGSGGEKNERKNESARRKGEMITQIVQSPKRGVLAVW
jgi:hypothetical protein